MTPKIGSALSEMRLPPGIVVAASYVRGLSVSLFRICSKLVEWGDDGVV